MTDSTKATRATIQIGRLAVDGFMLPDGSYRMSQTQAAETIGKPEINVRRFWSTKTAGLLLGKGYTLDKIEAEGTSGQRGSTRFNAVPLAVVAAYWAYELSKGNQRALPLVVALTAESLERRFDNAFGVQKSEGEYNQGLAQQILELEESLQDLSDAYAEPDLLREQVSRLEQQVRDLGIEPWQPPGDD